MTLLRLEWLPLLAVVPTAWLAVRALERARGRRLESWVGPRLAALSDARPSDALRGALFAAALALGTVSALHPAWGGDATDVERRGSDVVLCLDVSRSMLARDVDPDRLRRAKAEIAALARHARGDRLGLVVFAGEARTLVPLTSDVRSFEALLETADPTSVRVGGTDLAAALEAAVPGTGSSQAVVVLLTDGEDLAGRGLAAAERLRLRGVRVHAVGFGTLLGSKIAVPAGERGERFLTDRRGAEVVTTMDPASLSRLARAGDGELVDATRAPGALVSLYERRIRPLAQRAFEASARARREDRYAAPLALALLLAMGDRWLEGRRRVRRRAPVAGATLASASPSRARVAALAALLLLLGRCGGDPSAAREADVALAALRAGDPARAEAAASRAAAIDEAFTGLRDFARGSAAWARSEAAEAASEGPEAQPGAAEAALMQAEDALAAWRTAAASRADWPQARRNVERALLRIERLRRRSAKTDGGAKDAPADPKAPLPPPSPDVVPLPRIEDLGDPAVAGDPPDLPASEVRRLLDVLAEKEKQKAALRRDRRHAPGGAVERDW